MKPCLCKALFTSLFLILICPNVSVAANAIDPGMLMYKAGHLEQAKQYYEAEIVAAPKNANAHYMLANILLGLKRSDDARKEYKFAEVLDPYGSTGQCSRLALTRLGGKPAAISSMFQPDSKDNLNQSSMSLPNKTDSRQKMNNTVRIISAEVNDEEQKKQAECDAKVKRIYEESDAKVQQIEEEMQERIDANGCPVHGSHASYNPEPLNEMVRQECNERIDKIRSQACHQADEVMAAYKEKAIALEDSAVALDKSYINNQQTGSPSLMPAGTNMYVRNYQTADSPSGSPVPVMAAPAKLLPGIQPGAKTSR